MTDRELMQQALEALEFFWNAGYRNIAEQQKTLITALRDRLAQPEKGPVALVVDGVLVKSELPEKYTGHLYTSPPQRKPLTDEECDDLWAAQLFDIDDKFSAREFIRDVEDAHDIKENT